MAFIDWFIGVLFAVGFGALVGVAASLWYIGIHGFH